MPIKTIIFCSPFCFAGRQGLLVAFPDISGDGSISDHRFIDYWGMNNHKSRAYFDVHQGGFDPESL